MTLKPGQGLVLAAPPHGNCANHIGQIQLLYPASCKKSTEITQAALIAGHHNQP